MPDIPASLEASGRQHHDGMVKTWEDADRYLTLLDRWHPDGVIEIGTFSGKSALWFAKHTGRPVVTVDVHPQVDAATEVEMAEWNVTRVVGDSRAPATYTAVAGWWRRHCVTDPLVILDGDHSAATVKAEMGIYGALITVGGYMVVEDTLARYMPDQLAPKGPYTGSPWDAVEAFLEERPGEWEIDQVLVEMHGGVGQFPDGWLRRVR